jgi:hypothetical protein
MRHDVKRCEAMQAQASTGGLADLHLPWDLVSSVWNRLLLVTTSQFVHTLLASEAQTIDDADFNSTFTFIARKSRHLTHSSNNHDLQ